MGRLEPLTVKIEPKVLCRKYGKKHPDFILRCGCGYAVTIASQYRKSTVSSR